MDSNEQKAINQEFEKINGEKGELIAQSLYLQKKILALKETLKYTEDGLSLITDVIKQLRDKLEELK